MNIQYLRRINLPDCLPVYGQKLSDVVLLFYRSDDAVYGEIVCI